MAKRLVSVKTIMNSLKLFNIFFILSFFIFIFSYNSIFDQSEDVKLFFDKKKFDAENIFQTDMMGKLSSMFNRDEIVRSLDSVFYDKRLPKNYIEEYYRLKKMFEQKEYDLIIDYKPKYLKGSLKYIYDIFQSFSYYQLQDYHKTLEISKNFSSDLSKILKIVSYYRLNQFEKVLLEFEDFSNFTEYIDLFELYVHLSFLKKDYENTLKYLDVLLEKLSGKKDYNYFLYLKSQILFKKGFFKKSLSLCKDIILSEVNDSVLIGNAYYLAGKNYFMLGDYDNMENYLSVFLHTNLQSDFKKNGIFLDGKGFFIKGDYKKAIKKLEFFIDEYPEDELTVYAQQMITESYFYLKNYKKFREYFEKNYPDFIKEKLIYLKYFSDYKEKIYNDSISAYIAFIENEPNNPFKKNAYEKIIEESDDDSLKLKYLTEYILEYSKSDKFYTIFENNISFIYKMSNKKFIYDFFNSLNFKDERSCKLLFLFSNYLYTVKEFNSLIKLAQNNLEKLIFYRKEIEFLYIKSLKDIGNYEAAIFLIDRSLKIQKEMADSLILIKFEIFSKMDDIENMKKFVEKIQVSNIFLEGELNRMLAEKLIEKKAYTDAKTYLKKALILYSDNRNMVALTLIELSDVEEFLGDNENSMIFAQQALLFATDINLINRIKVKLEKR